MLLETPAGPARAAVEGSGGQGLLVLGHGAGGGIEAGDLVAARDGALAAGWSVALVEQPWRVQGRRVAPAPARLDLAWTAVVPELRRRHPGGPLVLGGRSAGARVACRTCGPLEAHGVLALAFPLHPPGRPERSRADELRAALRSGARVRVVQGRRDAFGSDGEVAAAVPGCDVVAVDGDHSMRVAPGVATAVRDWLEAWP